MKRVLVIDGTNAFYRAHIVDPSLSANGKPIGGLKGFLKIFQKLCRDMKPDRIVICWDGAGGSKKRKAMDKGYKAGRAPLRLNRNHSMLTPDEEHQNMIEQQLKLFDYIDEMPVIQLIAEGVEADDLIAVACQEFTRAQKIIISSDKDFYQLLDDETILYRPIQKKFYNKRRIVEEFDIHPKNFALARAAVGDKSDNIEGVKGIGLKTISKRVPILKEDKDVTVSDLIKYCKEVDSDLSCYTSLIEEEDKLKQNYKMMQLYSPLVSIQLRTKIKSMIENYPKQLSKTEIKKMMIKDGFPEIRMTDLFACMNRIADEV